MPDVSSYSRKFELQDPEDFREVEGVAEVYAKA